MRPSHSPPQLVQLRQPHVIRPVDHDRVGGRHVDAALDDGRTDQQVEAPMIEIHHQLLEVARSHLAVPDPDTRLGHQRLHLARDLLDRADFVVHEVHLPTAAQLAQRRLAQCRPVPLDHERLDGQPLGRRSRNQRQIAQPTQRHVERPRYRGRRQSQHVYVRA